MKNVSGVLISSSLAILAACSTAGEGEFVSQGECQHTTFPCAYDNSLAVLAEPELVALIQPQLEAAARQFQQKFGRAPTTSIVVPGGSVDDDLSRSLKGNGYNVIMPWLSASDRRSLQEDSVRKQIETAMASHPDALCEAAIQSALAQLSDKPRADHSLEQIALPHEMGHKWFIHEYGSKTAPETGHAYGGWAPDWLDEAAAIAMEPETSKATRRSRFSEMISANRVFPLSEFLTMVHPAADAAKALSQRRNAMKDRLGDADESPSSNVAIVLTGEDAKQFMRDSGGDAAPDFYAQSLVFSDYLVAKSDRSNVIAVTARALSEGLSFEDWLPINPLGLPQDLNELQADWDTYVETIR